MPKKRTARFLVPAIIFTFLAVIYFLLGCIMGVFYSDVSEQNKSFFCHSCVVFRDRPTLSGQDFCIFCNQLLCFSRSFGILPTRLFRTLRAAFALFFQSFGIVRTRFLHTLRAVFAPARSGAPVCTDAGFCGIVWAFARSFARHLRVGFRFARCGHCGALSGL